MSRYERDRWLIFLKKRQGIVREKWEWYLAKVMFLLYRLQFLMGGKPDNKKKVKDFLIDFGPKEKESPKTPTEKRELAQKNTLQGKLFVLGMRSLAKRTSVPANIRVGKKKPPRLLKKAEANSASEFASDTRNASKHSDDHT